MFWKSSQDCVDGCVPGQVSVPELEVSREEDHQHGGGAQGHQQGAEEGGVVAPGGEEKYFQIYSLPGL